MHLHRGLGGAAVAVLRVQDGAASGGFSLSGGFMHTRVLKPVQPVELYEARAASGGDTRSTAVSGQVLHDRGFALFASFLMPGVQHLGLVPEDGPEQRWLVGSDGSWAYQSTGDHDGLVAVQGGPARLWDRLEKVHAQWKALGSPRRREFGLTVDGSGRHTLWHGSPAGPSWEL